MKRMLHDIKSCFLLYFDLHISGSSAELSYYFLFSVFPLIMAMSAVTFMNIDGTGMVFSFLEAILPEMVTELLSDFYDYVRDLNNTAFFSFGAMLALYAIARYVTVIKRKIREIFTASQEYGIIKEWGLSFGIAVLIVLGLYLTFFLQILGQRIVTFFSEHLLFLPQSVIERWLFLRFAAIGVYVFFLLFSAYRFIPNKKLKRRDVLPGTFFSSLAWIVVSVIFSFYVDHISRYSSVYGSIAAFIVMMLWLFLINNIILIGALINRVLYERRHENAKSFV